MGLNPGLGKWGSLENNKDVAGGMLKQYGNGSLRRGNKWEQETEEKKDTLS